LPSGILLIYPEHARTTAHGWFWQANDCKRFADASDVSGLTRRINGGTNGLADRIARTRIAEQVLL